MWSFIFFCLEWIFVWSGAGVLLLWEVGVGLGCSTWELGVGCLVVGLLDLGVLFGVAKESNYSSSLVLGVGYWDARFGGGGSLFAQESNRPSFLVVGYVRLGWEFGAFGKYEKLFGGSCFETVKV